LPFFISLASLAGKRRILRERRYATQRFFRCSKNRDSLNEGAMGIERRGA
jgi:hypothetical protein